LSLVDVQVLDAELLHQVPGHGLLVVLVISMLVCGSLNTMIERAAYRPLRGAPKLAPLITAGRLLLHPRPG